MPNRIFATAAILLLAATAVVRADNWPGWRGPTSNGVAPGEGFPTSWSERENVAWKYRLPGGSGSTPAVWDDRIFLTCPGDQKNLAICLDRDGNPLWQTAIGDLRPGKHRKGSGANPSPATDGQFVFVYYKSGDLACLDFEGNIVWRTNLQDRFGEDTLWWDLGTSPVLTEQAVVVAVMHSGPSYLVALDKSTGSMLWKQDRNLGAPEEAAQSYSTPVVVEHAGRQKIVVLGADHVTAHDAATGKELWRAGGLNPTQHKYFRSIASPVVSDGIVVAPYARGGSITAIRMGGQGDVTDSHVAWIKEGIGADVPTPLAADGRVIVCTDRGQIVCFEIETGKEIWSTDLEKGRAVYSASPVLADGRLYVTREDGTTFVLDANDPTKAISKNVIDEYTLASPVPVDGKILLRTFDHLYCIGK